MAKSRKVDPDTVEKILCRLWRKLEAMPAGRRKTGITTALAVAAVAGWSSYLWAVHGSGCSISLSQTIVVDAAKSSTDAPSFSPALKMLPGFETTITKPASLSTTYRPTPAEERAGACLPAWAS